LSGEERHGESFLSRIVYVGLRTVRRYACGLASAPFSHPV
jgi:hypothetical protein